MCTGMWRVAGLCLSASSTESPERSGRFTSSTIALGRSCSASWSPSSAVWATRAWNSSSWARSRTILAKAGSSSMTRIARAPAASSCRSSGTAPAAGTGSPVGEGLFVGGANGRGRRGPGEGDGRGAAAGGGAAASRTRWCAGSSSVKVLPRPGALSRVTSPPSSRARSREIERPRPVPPYFRFVVPSAWRKASKITSCCSGAIPIPVSSTSKATRPSRAGRTRSETPPRSVNFTAFESRFFSTCWRRCGSVWIVSTPGSRVRLRSSLFCWASGWKVPLRSSMSRRSGTVSGRTSSLPASIFERSRMSLMRVRRSLPAE
jgi:hypothetical protein